MKITDISTQVSTSMLFWPGTPEPIRTSFDAFEEGGTSRHSVWTLSMHCGTHVDAPAHILRDGVFIDQLSLHSFIGWTYVADLTHVVGEIQPAHLASILLSHPERLLLKTTNSLFRLDQSFNRDYVSLSEAAAKTIVEHGIKLVGIDYLGIEPFRNLPACPTHEILLRANIPILEGICLGSVEAGEYLLVALPLCLDRTEASIVRAVLVEDDDGFARKADRS